MSSFRRYFVANRHTVHSGADCVAMSSPGRGWRRVGAVDSGVWRRPDRQASVFEQFASIAPLLWIELLGDAIKCLAMPFVAFFVYQRNLRYSWILELMFSICFVLATHVLTGIAGLAGAPIAYVLANLSLLLTALPCSGGHGMPDMLLLATLAIVVANLVSGAFGSLDVQAPITALSLLVCIARADRASSSPDQPNQPAFASRRLCFC